MTDNILDEDKRLTTISFYVSRLTSSARRLNQHAGERGGKCEKVFRLKKVSVARLTFDENTNHGAGARLIQTLSWSA